MNTGMTLYIEKGILSKNNGFDKAHWENYARMVIEQCLEIARHYAVKWEWCMPLPRFMIWDLPST